MPTQNKLLPPPPPNPYPLIPPPCQSPSSHSTPQGRATIRDLQILLKHQSWDTADSYLRPHFNTATRIPSPTEGLSVDTADADAEGMRTPDAVG